MEDNNDTYHFNDNNIVELNTKLQMVDLIIDIYQENEEAKDYQLLWYYWATLVNSGKVTFSRELVEEIVNDKRVKRVDTSIDRLNEFCDTIIKQITHYTTDEEMMS